MRNTRNFARPRLPSFSGLTGSNSITIPSVFILRLPTPLPLSLTLAALIADVTGIKLKDITGTVIITRLLSLLLAACNMMQDTGCSVLLTP